MIFQLSYFSLDTSKYHKTKMLQYINAEYLSVCLFICPGTMVCLYLYGTYNKYHGYCSAAPDPHFPNKNYLNKYCILVQIWAPRTCYPLNGCFICIRSNTFCYFLQKHINITIIKWSWGLQQLIKKKNGWKISSEADKIATWN